MVTDLSGPLAAATPKQVTPPGAATPSGPGEAVLAANRLGVDKVLANRPALDYAVGAAHLTLTCPPSLGRS
jgi:hypothetical protein